MDNKMIIVEGYLASGKSTFAGWLSKELRIPCLIKDTFKEALCSSIPIADRKESSRFSAVTFDAMMYVTERMLENEYPIILEGNFVPAGIKAVDEAEAIRQLIRRYGYSALTFKFVGDTPILHHRFTEREMTPERGQANRIGSEVSFEDFDKWCHNLDAFEVEGAVIRVDGTDFDKVHYGELAEAARRFFGRPLYPALRCPGCGCQVLIK